MRRPRFRLRTTMVGIAFVAVILTVIIQAALLRRAAFTEHVLRDSGRVATGPAQGGRAEDSGRGRNAACYRGGRGDASSRRTCAGRRSGWSMTCC